ncbi:hypothetical protein ABK040_004234 [Willaertia magna]
MSLITSPTRLSIFIFGIVAFLSGIVGVFSNSPSTLLSFINFNETIANDNHLAHTFFIASSMASLNMGAYYILAAWFNVKIFFIWTVPFRVLTFLVFTKCVISGIAPSFFQLVANGELIGALVTGLSLWYERTYNVVNENVTREHRD